MEKNTNQSIQPEIEKGNAGTWSPEKIASLRTRLREHTLNQIIKLPQLLKASREASTEAYISANYDRRVPHPNLKASIALDKLSDSVGTQVWAHGVASNLRSAQDTDFAINALVNILVTGELQGWSAPVKGGVSIFDSAPFILLSNKGEQLVARDDRGVQHITGLRTVLVNGQYEGVIGLLKEAFPFISFRTSDQIDDRVFEKVDPPYKSYQAREEAEIERRIREEGNKQ
jgi:hypothetical protein